MKAKVIETGETLDLYPYHSGYWIDLKTQCLYREPDLEFIPDTSEKIIEGWVTKDSPDDDVTFHFNRPYLRKDYPDDIEIWESIGSTYLFAQSLFPDLSSSEPKRVKITITPME